ncbi:cadmium resistance protein CadD (predicted permease) [Streptacidiphilus sp. MAP12-33]|uniref:cadmium resistance transporter n=1 Tax=Streptacidiphilus sp. MAP12-33 TaxID=3156266 RepID=UPI003518BFE0
MAVGTVGQAVGLFAVTNVDDILVLSLFFARGSGEPGLTRRIMVGQYLAFAVILAVSVAAALGASFLPRTALPYLGLLPLALGLRAARQSWRHRAAPGEAAPRSRQSGPRTLEVAALTLANGGDNIGVYTPVLATAGPGGIAVYAAVFLALVAVWCLAGRYLATRPAVAKALGRWGDVLHPVVLSGIGLFVLIDGGAL